MPNKFTDYFTMNQYKQLTQRYTDTPYMYGMYDLQFSQSLYFTKTKEYLQDINIAHPVSITGNYSAVKSGEILYHDFRT